MTVNELLEVLMQVDASLGDQVVQVVYDTQADYEEVEEVSVENDAGGQHVVMWTTRRGLSGGEARAVVRMPDGSEEAVHLVLPEWGRTEWWTAEEMEEGRKCETRYGEKMCRCGRFALVWE